MSALNHIQFVHFTNAELKPGDEVTPPASRGAEPQEWSRRSPAYKPEHVYFADQEALYDQGFHLSYGKHAYEVAPTGPWHRDAEFREGTQSHDNETEEGQYTYDPYGPLSWQTKHPLRVVRHVQTGDNSFGQSGGF